jgi:hypothetical protein
MAEVDILDSQLRGYFMNFFIIAEVDNFLRKKIIPMAITDDDEWSLPT